MKISDFSGKQTVSFKKAVQWLNQNQKRIQTLAGLFPFHTDFSAPHYWGMPRGISGKLSAEQVVWIYGQTKGWLKTKSTVLEPIIISIPRRNLQKLLAP